MLKTRSIFIFVLVLCTSMLAQIQLTLPSASGKPGDEKVLNVLVSDLTGKEVQGFQFRISYNPTFIEISAPPNNSGTLVESNPPMYGSTSGTFTAVAVSNSYYAGAGILYKIKVKFLQLGSTNLTLDATFTNKFSGDKSFNVSNGLITVTSTNNPPVFDAIPSKSVNENQELKFTVNAVDPEGDVLTYAAQYSFTGPTFNSTTKEFVWKPTYTQAGSYSVTFSAFDGTSTATTTVNITVNDVNTAPVITPIPDKSVNEGVTLTFDITATDAEGDVLTYSATNLPTGALFDATARKFTWKPSSTQAGEYFVTFSVFDGKLSASTSVKITVIDANAAPEITPINDKTINTGQTLSFELLATDADGDALTYGTSTLPQGASFDATTKKFSWKPTSSQAGDYEISFFVSDGKLTSSIKVKIKVVKVNSAPVFDSKTITDTTISVHTVSMLFKYQFKVTDPDGDALTYRLDGDYPSGSTLSASGLFNWITTKASAGRVFMFMVTASDGFLSETKVVTITVRSTIVGIEDEQVMPTKFDLAQNYPNPFNPTTSIKYSLPKESNVLLKVFNVMGEEIKTLVNSYKSAGTHTVNFDASGLTSGFYIYKIETSEFSKTMKMLLTK